MSTAVEQPSDQSVAPRFDRDAGPPQYVYVKVADHIALRIRAGELPPGSMLPAQHALAKRYDVAVGTARKAVEVLRNRSLVTTLPGKGTFVLPPT